MKVDILFSRNEKIGSKLISYASSFENTGLSQIPSHAAVLLDDSIVVESTLSTGVRIIPYANWLTINECLYKYPAGENFTNREIFKKINNLWGKKYDWGGILFFLICFIRLIIQNKEIPKHNKWQSGNKYFCTEFVGFILGLNGSMKTPAKLCSELLNESN
jgi:hypothetical protein